VIFDFLQLHQETPENDILSNDIEVLLYGCGLGGQNFDLK